MKSFAYYRLPYADHYIALPDACTEVRLFHSFEQLEGCNGFVVAPFQVTDQTPIVLIDSCGVCQRLSYQDVPTKRCDVLGFHDNHDTYVSDFFQFHHQLEQHAMTKLVLSRTSTVSVGNCDSFSLFIRACQRYPRMFVALVAMPDGSQWLTATPEVLLQGSGHNYSTMALAGTMRLSGDELLGEGEHMRWAAKDIEEQRLVSSYIADQLKALSIAYDERGPRTVRAADLVHLRSDFTFQLPGQVSMSSVIAALHPTPAVCGLPKQESFQFILEHEHSHREYYSGFMGPLDQQDDGGLSSTHLFVTLRCMKIQNDSLTLYAGGGLLTESQQDHEWQETEAKMDTMRNIIC
ncbi:MAG: isochorismate synthase [Prevotella sp.]|nr:isochorismate synthase [Prevotella sp.]